jgi:ATP-dependent Clp protease ATP-binding subunit ClpC
MSEFMEKFSVSRLVGAPPGYVGYEEGGQLTERVRRKPYSVVLLDEIEKAHPDVFNILLQVLEDGQLTDSLKRKVNFKNTVLIMTSNIGARLIRGQGRLGFQQQDAEVTYAQMKATVMDEVRKIFNPEFLNRVDEIIVFKALDRPELEQIIEILLNQVRDRLREKEITLTMTPGAVNLLLEKGYEPALGARPLRRAIQKLIEDPLSEMVMKGKIQPGCEVKISKRGNDLAFEEKLAESTRKR